MIIDYHAHLPWNEDEQRYESEWLLADMGNNGINQRVVSALQGNGITEQNDAVAQLVRSRPDQILGCAVLNPKERGCLDEMQRIASMGLFCAIELDSFEHNYIPESMKVIDDIIRIAVEHKMVVNVFTGWGCRTMPAQWAYYAARHPDMTMVLLHMGTTDFGYGCIDLAGQYANLYLETSCMYELPILRKSFSSLPAEKFLFGSHFPHKITTCSIHTFDLLHLTPDFEKKLFYRNAETVLHI